MSGRADKRELDQVGVHRRDTALSDDDCVGQCALQSLADPGELVDLNDVKFDSSSNTHRSWEADLRLLISLELIDHLIGQLYESPTNEGPVAIPRSPFVQGGDARQFQSLLEHAQP